MSDQRSSKKEIPCNHSYFFSLFSFLFGTEEESGEEEEDEEEEESEEEKPRYL